MDFVQVGAVWLHSVAMVIVIGYYGILARVVLPALSRSLDGVALGRAIVAVERRSIPLVLLSIGAFTTTGIYLLVVDARYAGLGNVFASTWTTLMLIKHVVVFAMVILGVVLDHLASGIDGVAEAERPAALHELTLAAEAMTGLGAVVLLLTAAAQAS
jgi:uncharacterized membrane protein